VGRRRLRLLLDTHSLAWWLLDDRRLSPKAHGVNSDPDNEIWASAVSAFEAATIYRLAKWADIHTLALSFDAAVRAEGFESLPITVQHASRGGLLVGAYRDPFDRLLAAQSLVEAMPIVTNDPMFETFGVPTLW
jgi:PIN domain nuclease of toxin-antitoxin system